MRRAEKTPVVTMRGSINYTRFVTKKLYLFKLRGRDCFGIHAKKHKWIDDIFDD